MGAIIFVMVVCRLLFPLLNLIVPGRWQIRYPTEDSFSLRTLVPGMLLFRIFKVPLYINYRPAVYISLRLSRKAGKIQLESMQAFATGTSFRGKYFTVIHQLVLSAQKKGLLTQASRLLHQLDTDVR